MINYMVSSGVTVTCIPHRNKSKPFSQMTLYPHQKAPREERYTHITMSRQTQCQFLYVPSDRGLDINALGFKLTNLTHDTFLKDTNVSYEMDVMVTITGSRVSPDVDQFGTEHFDWAFVLSEDDVYDEMQDYTTDRVPLEPEQVALLRVS